MRGTNWGWDPPTRMPSRRRSARRSAPPDAGRGWTPGRTPPTARAAEQNG